MRRLVLAVKKLWLLATCNHANCGRCIEWDDTTSITVCRKCGIVMQIVLNEGGKSSFTKSGELGAEMIAHEQAMTRSRVA